MNLTTVTWALKKNKSFIITGNFNLNLIKHMQNTRVNHLLEKILSNNVLPQIALYTTITERQQHWLMAYLQIVMDIILIVYQVITTCISDLLFQFLITENLMQPSFKQNPAKSLLMTKITLMKRLSRQNLVDLIGHLLQRIMI